MFFCVYKLKPFLHDTKFINIVEGRKELGREESVSRCIYLQFDYSLNCYCLCILCTIYFAFTFNTILTSIISKDLQENITIEIIL